MYYFGAGLVTLGLAYFLLMILRPPWLLNNFKVKIMIKKMGFKGFWIFFIGWASLILLLGLYIVDNNPR